ncbi:hypothetical protein Acr_21g0003980 [Actinidia rufa]|uniref:Uncharacterized protein n=1 Tax=Actinidia rufa TaxID=165716 RepID=A0A7J0GG71_9ERIC|nr:hypothetical protein Acr_21g0003980 [Actinidia rufa]
MCLNSLLLCIEHSLSIFLEEGQLQPPHQPFSTSSNQFSYKLVGTESISLWHIGCALHPVGSGSCGYELNLGSSGRNTITIGSKYGKSIKRGITSFFFIDESRFTQVEELQCVPYISKNSWGLFARERSFFAGSVVTIYVGTAYEDHDSPYPYLYYGYWNCV